jgi:Sigma-70, region 4
VAAPETREEPEDLLALSGMIAALPEVEREVIVLRFFQDLDQYEIAARVGFSQMHVSRLQHRRPGPHACPIGGTLTRKGAVAMQIIWMMLVTLVLALSGVLGLALVTHIAAWTRRQ